VVRLEVSGFRLDASLDLLVRTRDCNRRGVVPDQHGLSRRLASKGVPKRLSPICPPICRWRADPGWVLGRLPGVALKSRAGSGPTTPGSSRWRRMRKSIRASVQAGPAGMYNGTKTQPPCSPTQPDILNQGTPQGRDARLLCSSGGTFRHDLSQKGKSISATEPFTAC